VERRGVLKTALLCLSFTTMSTFEVGLLGTLVPFIIRDLKLSYEYMGFLLSLGSIPPLLMIPFLGSIMARLKPLTLFNVVIITLTASNLAVYLVPTTAMIALTRIVAGLFALYVWPLCSLAVSANVDESRRAFATSIYNPGSLLGLALTYLALLPSNDWRYSLLLSSVAGFIYTALSYPPAKRVFTFSIAKSNPGSTTSVNVVRSTVSSRSFLATMFFAHFTALIQWSLAFSWLSSYLFLELSTSITLVAASIGAIALAGSVTQVVAGIVADRIGGARGAAILLASGFTASATALTLMAFTESSEIKLALILSSMIAFSFAAPGIWSLVSFLVPVEEQPRFSPVFTAAVPLASIFTAILGGFIAKLLNTFTPNFIVAGLSSAVSAFLFWYSYSNYGRTETSGRKP